MIIQMKKGDTLVIEHAYSGNFQVIEADHDMILMRTDTDRQRIYEETKK